MKKINFVNNSEPYLSAENLNQMQEIQFLMKLETGCISRRKLQILKIMQMITSIEKNRI